MPPTHPDDEYLFEFDLDEKGRMQFDTDGQNPKFSDRAKAAQEAKWRRLTAIYAPRKTIKESLLANSGGNPPRLVFGWAYDREYVLAYATHHNIHYDASKDPWLTKEAGTTLIKFGEFTEEQKKNEALMNSLKPLAGILVREDLSRRAGIRIVRECPFSYDWTAMWALYNNYNIDERVMEMKRAGGVRRVADIIQEALTFGDYNPELLWWYDWHYLRVSLMTPL